MASVSANDKSSSEGDSCLISFRHIKGQFDSQPIVANGNRQDGTDCSMNSCLLVECEIV